MEREELEDVEIQLLLEGIYRYYGFDFRNYALASLKRRIWNTVKTEGLTTISGLQEKVLHEPEYLERLLLNLSINVTAMFRNPNFFLTFRKKVIPILRTYPFIRIWHAGCSTGEEVYSMAILLKEEGLYHRSRLYATDINEIVLRKAKSGIFPLVMMQEYTHNYIQAGGKKAFSEYYTAAYGNAIFSSELKENIIFSLHNLATDNSFNEFHVIFCRNVLIYFNKNLQHRVHKLFYESLIRFGILGLGRQESIRFTPHEQDYEQLVSSEKIYRRVS
ncbi:chemotaxis protein CheR [Fischerella thermalis BR2B]|uniref:CheR family methyltransferase n=1 Tax=Fischerella thermalis TaxID=372787 RepID=UPI0002E3A321|nr:protein-glutamate O-methyltransferase CheR [Fischerella thermalis]PMB28212.1 chemotaxis protein CheR [Fischerella thermalis BR2B]